MKFIEDHPEYFEVDRDYWRIHGELSALIERYAKAFDPEEYRMLQARVERARQEEQNRLQAEIDQLTQRRSREEQAVESLNGDLGKLEKEHKKLERKLETLKERLEAPEPEERWYTSDATFLGTTLAGIFFLYLGVILEMEAKLGCLIAGFAFLMVGFLLQQHMSPSPVYGEVARRQVESQQNQTDSLRHLTRIKRITLIEKKKHLLREIGAINQEIEDHLAKLEILNA